MIQFNHLSRGCQLFAAKSERKHTDEKSLRVNAPFTTTQYVHSTSNSTPSNLYTHHTITLTRNRQFQRIHVSRGVHCLLNSPYVYLLTCRTACCFLQQATEAVASCRVGMDQHMPPSVAW